MDVTFVLHLILRISQVSGLCLRPGPESFHGEGRNGSRYK